MSAPDAGFEIDTPRQQSTASSACPVWHVAPVVLAGLVILFASGQMTLAASTVPPVRHVSVTFRDGGVLSVPVSGGDVKIKTTAGQIRIPADTITSMTRADDLDRIAISLSTGERWVTDAETTISAVFGKDAATAWGRHGSVLQSARFQNQPLSTGFDHCYRILLLDGGMAIVPPASVAIPVNLMNGKADIPLGTIKALKLSFPDGRIIPESVFARFSSGDIHQLEWRHGQDTLEAQSVSGNRLRIRPADILGIVPVSRASSPPGRTPDEVFTLVLKNESVMTTKLPLQRFDFSTSMGVIRLPAPVVTSYTIPQKRRDPVQLKTIFGETFIGRPAFKYVYIEHVDETRDRIHVNNLKCVERPHSAALDIPAHAFVFSLGNGSTVAGTPANGPLRLLGENGEVIPYQASDTLTQARGGFFMLARPDGTATSVRPMTASVDLYLTVNGQSATIPWRDVQRIDGRRQIVALPPPPRADGPPTVTPAMQAATDRLVRDGEAEAVGRQPLALRMTWGPIQVAPDMVSEMIRSPRDRHAYILTSTGDIILTEISSRRARRALRPLSTYMADPESNRFESISLPPDRATTTNNVTLRLMRGDILRGALVGDTVPFRPVDNSDTRTTIPTVSLRRIMHTGESTLAYVTGQGTHIGQISPDTIRFMPRLDPATAEIPLTAVELLSIGDTPLPPPTVFLPDHPPALSSEIRLPEGAFRQGSSDSGIPDESPRITITVSAFFMDATEVTRAQFAAFVKASGYQTTAEQVGALHTWQNPGFLQMPDDPVVSVSWLDAAAFCNWRSRQCDLQNVYTFRRDGNVTTDRTANGYRLPTESEWEYAAGGRRGSVFPWGDAQPSATQPALPANYLQRDDERHDGWRWTNPVNAFPPTSEGLYGMAGNVWEWCEDWYFDRAYDILRNRSPFNPCITQTEVPGLTHRVMRGGSYRNRIDFLRVASRGSGLPFAHAPHVGFRCVRNAPGSPR